MGFSLSSDPNGVSVRTTMAVPVHARLPQPPPVQAVSSGFAEAAAILGALVAWRNSFPILAGRILVRSVSMVIVEAWGRQSSPNPLIQRYIRAFAHMCCVGNFSLSIVHIPGTENSIADAISRQQVARFRLLHPLASQLSLPPPPQASFWLM